MSGLKKATLSFTSAFLLFVGLAIAGEDWQAQPVGPFSGLNNRDNSYAIPAVNAQDLLNVNITPGGKSVFKRKGYGISYTMPISSSPVHGVYTFFDANGNNVDLYAGDVYFVSLTNGINQVTLLASSPAGPNGATYQCTDSLGFAYCANSSRSALYKTNGQMISTLSGIISTGTMVATAVTRLAMAGFSDRPSGIDFSADSDFTSWGFGSLGTSPVQLTVSAPGAKITHITYAFGRLMWFKDSSFGYVLIGNQPAQTDWVIKTVSYDVGTNDNTSIYREGILYFRGQDGHIYSFDGNTYQRLSREISATIGASQSRTSNSWTQTTQSDFQAGATSPAGWIDTTTASGQLFLSIGPAPANFIDTVSTDFAAGTLTNVSTITVPGSVTLAYGPQNVLASFYPGGDSGQCATLCTAPYYQSQSISNILITSNAFLSSALMRLKKTGSPGQFRADFRSDNNGVPGLTMESVNIDASSVSTSVADSIINFSSTTKLLANTTYWLVLVPLGTCDVSNKIEWYGTGGSGVTIPTGCGASPTTSFQKYAYKVFSTTFQASGNIVSRSFDIGFDTFTWLWNWGNFVANYKNLIGIDSISFETETSTAATGPWSGFVGVSSGFQPVSPPREFFHYRANFTTTDQSTSPVIDDVSILISSLTRPAATFYSSVHNSPSLTAWDTFQSDISNNGGSQSFYIRASTNPIAIRSSTPTWSAINSGSIPSIPIGTYFQIRDDLSISNGTQNANLFDFIQNWFEGKALDKMYATYFDDKLWFSVNTGTNVAVNNRTLIYDMINQTWSLYDLPCNGFLVRQGKLYFGSSNSGYVYKFGDSDNDNGVAINSYWKSKDFFGGDPFTTDEIANISLVGKSVFGSSVTVSYVLNGSSTSSYIANMYSPGGQFTGKNKNIPAGLVANTYSIQFGNNAADQPFEIFAVQVGVRARTWAPTQ